MTPNSIKNTLTDLQRRPIKSHKVSSRHWRSKVTHLVKSQADLSLPVPNRNTAANTTDYNNNTRYLAAFFMAGVFRRRENTDRTTICFYFAWIRERVRLRAALDTCVVVTWLMCHFLYTQGVTLFVDNQNRDRNIL